MFRIPRVRGVRIDHETRASADWVRTAVLVAWALIAGLFLTVNGKTVFQRESYKAMMEAVPHPCAVGISLLLAGVLGLVGEWFGVRWLAKLFCALAAVWHGLYFGWTVPGNLGALGNTNMVSLFALLVALLYFVQLIEVWPQPKKLL